MKTYTKQLGDWELVAVPGRGGALAACRYRGCSILREATGIAEDGGRVTASAAYPMVPFCGRIEQGRFRFEGVDCQLDPNFPPEPHAIHGTGWQSSWAIDMASDRITMSLMDDSLRWPWPFLAEQVFSADGDTLQYELSVTNIGERVMPAGLGWHPFFVSGEASMQADLVARSGEGAQSDLASRLALGLDVSRLAIDTTFDWPARAAAFRYRDGRRVSLEASETTRCLTLYSLPGGDFICAEPLTHWPNAHNHSDPEAAGLASLAPGKTLRQRFVITVS